MSYKDETKSANYKLKALFEACDDGTASGIRDEANSKYSHSTLFLAREGTQQKWQMAWRFKSPAYTTRIAEVPVVKVGKR